MILMYGMDSLKELILADDSQKLNSLLAGMRAVEQLAELPSALDDLLDEVCSAGQSFGVTKMKSMI